MLKKMRKLMLFLVSLLVLMSAITMTSFAGQWKQDSVGWWYQNDDGGYPANCWKWIDGNNDGTAECYYFNENGYCLMNTMTPDGYFVDVNGAWIVDGVVQTQISSVVIATTTQVVEESNQVIKTEETSLSEEYSYLAGNAMRQIKFDYSTAKGRCAYVYAYHNIEGDLCVFINVWYRLVDIWNEEFLYNITTGKCITDPVTYYSKRATRGNYLDMLTEILDLRVKMAEATLSMLEGGSNTFDGVFVDSDILNQ